MAINQAKSRFVDSTSAIVAPGALIQASGAALVRLDGAQAAGVQLSTGVAGEKFVGFSFALSSGTPFLETVTNKVEVYVVPGSGIVTLSRTPIGGQVSVWDDTDGAAVASPTVTGAQISGLDPQHRVVVTYKYVETVFEARTRLGDAAPGGYSGDTYGQIGVVTKGRVYTTEFDASVNWRAATALKMAPNGQITDQNGTGNEITGWVIDVPNEDYPELGIEFAI